MPFPLLKFGQEQIFKFFGKIYNYYWVNQYNYGRKKRVEICESGL